MKKFDRRGRSLRKRGMVGGAGIRNRKAQTGPNPRTPREYRVPQG
jgi:hypothetical protein